MPRRDWTREELIVAFNLYCRIPFGRIHIRNPLVIELAKAIGRTPSAVSRKIANFARLDPALQKRNNSYSRSINQFITEVKREAKRGWVAFDPHEALPQDLSA
jgi:putative restriction endonuclease